MINFFPPCLVAMHKICVLPLSIYTHEFIESGTGTIMKDTFSYKSPFGILGIIVDKLFLEKYMRNFIVNRAKELKRIAEKK